MHTKISFFELVMEYCSVRIGSEMRKVNLIAFTLN